MKRVSLSVITALLLSVIVFISGFFAGEIYSGYKYGNVVREFYGEELDLLGFQLQLNLLSDSYACNRDLLEEISNARARIGSEIDFLERTKGKNDEEVRLLKERYLMYVYLTYVAFKQYKENCNAQDNIILFFYSNEPEYVEASEKQGFVLDYLYNKYKPYFHVFAIDLSIDNPLIKSLAKVYNVSSLPTLIINEKVKLEGLQSSDKIEALLFK